MESEAIMNFLYFVTLKSIGLFDTLNIFFQECFYASHIFLLGNSGLLSYADFMNVDILHEI